MLQVYADGALVSDHRLQNYGLLGLKTTRGVNKSGTATLILPPGHPAYNSFTSLRTIVEIFEDRALRFRGRALYPEDDFNNLRTIVCEGERGFLRDAVMRPYTYTTDPAAIFADVIGVYNAQVEAEKRFTVGTVNVTDANEYVRMESESAEQVSDTVDKLVERCGGYITFSTNTAGQRCINWLAELGYRSSQVIEFGSNLLDFSRTGANTALATAVLPYGAKDETTGQRIGIASVNGGQDYIQDDAAVALRGFICVPVVWDDVTQPSNLLTKARKYLATSKLYVDSLTLTAFDLSRMDKSLDSFMEGDLVRVKSRPHGVDEFFQLTDKEEDYFNPSAGSITMGKDKATLTGADVAGDRQSATALENAQHVIQSDYQRDIAQAVQEASTTLTSLIQQTSDSITLRLSEEYATDGEVTEMITSSMTQLSDSFTFLFESLQATVDENDAAARVQFETITKYIRFDGGDIILGEEGNELILHLENDRIAYKYSGAEAAYFSDKRLVISNEGSAQRLEVGVDEADPFIHIYDADDVLQLSISQTGVQFGNGVNMAQYTVGTKTGLGFYI